MSYVAEEDRLLFRLTTKDKKEYRMWLTRRFVGVLWGALGNTFAAKEDLAKITDAAVKDAVLGMKHQEAVQNTDFDTPALDDATDTTSNTGPLLVTGGKVQTGDKVTSLTFTTQQGSDVRFNLNEQLLHALCHLTVTTCQRAGWNLDLTMGASNVVVPTGETVLH